ncbi:MAG: hypothetical protein A2268_04055 [Candidatus Raymondbacteria bacterium RifOxyA12_full_50_37]|nr:MAG: hypothetical protein A2268_04055 [Candidatus Raymondbacteria bacterium RifOxyA12_full_50_37]OGJ92601.1 MAG: hypothetical protein A2248_05895 [Candidatus Raymondbacteria bacterium RIFOXYA2_FULL_49_16]OGJ92702.1 MAG: hypothetical protein A2350_16675 [Candidatus Raymondbacteria bacterium RifOxyB12_full_50_8]OGJ97955.1 MAG: hypothetical protein A2453_02920 [Candidatus Raymondbacteria bacterium RIFOXYC2_FULL_50_21]OGK02053.1 MAG: hypothetical protein A2487_01325 [Candidatus Raymondbacteria b
MHYRTLGRTGLTVSEIGLGTLAIGGPWSFGGFEFGRGQVDDKNSLKMISIALDAGVNFIDTADIYGYGKSEEIIGKGIEGKREKTVICTKVGNRGTEREWFKDFSPAWIKAACEQSLKRLKTDYIDVYLLHSPDEDFIFRDDLFTAFNELKKEGKIRFYGCSVVSPKQGVDFLSSGYGDVIETFYNICDRAALDDLFPAAQHADAGIVIKAPLCSGLLTGKYTKNTSFDPSDFRSELYPRERLEKIINVTDYARPFADRAGLSLSQFALKYCLTRDEVSTIIPGGKTAGQVLENVRASDGGDLPIATLEQIEEAIKDYLK